jgi:hypothetical protein
MFSDIDSEIQEAIEDVQFGVTSITIKEQTAKKMLNIVTLESLQVEVAVSERGFEITGNANKDASFPAIYESLSSLLMEISPKFEEAFHQKLADKLSALSESVE